MELHTVYISAGSNLGQRLKNCRKGIDMLTHTSGLDSGVGSGPGGPDVILTAQSSFYRTAPVDFTDQDWFVNAVFAIRTRLSPQALLGHLKEIQRRVGRKKSKIRFGPRVLDLDILLFDDLIISLPDLVIPHPRMHKRRFVLLPICDINPHLVHPILKREMGDLLGRLNENEQPVTLIDD